MLPENECQNGHRQLCQEYDEYEHEELCEKNRIFASNSDAKYFICLNRNSNSQY